MSMTPSSPAWTALGWTSLHMLWIGAAIGLAASLLRRALRRASAEARHAAALASLVLLTAAPFATFAVVHVPAAPTLLLSAPGPPAAKAATARPAAPRVALAASRSRIEPASKQESPNRLRFLDPWISVLPGVWLVGSALTSAWLAMGLAGVGRLRRDALPLEAGPVVERARALARSLGIAHVAVAACDRIAAPVLIGVVRPMILLPTSALTGWSPEHLEMAMLHELAHLRRRDNLVSLFQKLAEALLFFHPTTWWLSAWVRLERETCCDRLVVARTDRPRAYAELLAALAAARPAPGPALSLTERPITTRIRRILLKEDPPMTMKPTAPEALALGAAILLAAALVLPTRAEPPAANPKPGLAADLRRMAEKAIAEPAPDDPLARDGALAAIAGAQARQGDKPGALATLSHVRVALPNGDGPVDDAYAGKLALALDVARVRHDAGDVAGGRELALRVGDSLLTTDPAMVRFAVRRLEEQMAQRMSRNIGLAAGGVRVEVMSMASNGEERKSARAAALPDDDAKQVEAAFEKFEMLIDWFGESAALITNEDADRALAKILAFCGTMDEPSRSLLTVGLGTHWVRQGEADRGRALIDRARRSILALPEGERKDVAVLGVAIQLASLDEFEAVLDLLPSLRPESRPAAVRLAFDSIQFSGRGWSPETGLLGGPLAAPPLVRDKAVALAKLPRILTAARGLDDAAERRRFCATAAQVQAVCGDFAGALQTADSIADRDPGDGPAHDGRLDDATLKPITFALLASLQAESGDQPGADAAFARAERLAESVSTEADRTVARVALVEQLARSGRREAARAAMERALPAALGQPEPRRSRLLCVLADAKAEIDGVAEASKIVDALRAEPGLEKAYAFRSLALKARQAGDAEASRSLALRALPLAEPKPSDAPPRAGFSIELPDSLAGFLDPELQPAALKLQRDIMLPSIRELAGLAAPKVDDQAKAASGLVVQPEAAALSRYKLGGFEAAMAEIDTLGSASKRFRALRGMAQDLGRTPPVEEPKADARTDLQRIAEAVAAIPAAADADEPTTPNQRIVALTDIARKQLDRGDRAGALKTLDGVKIGPFVGRDLSRDLAALLDLEASIESAAIRYDAGEVEAARAEFRRAVELVAKPDPAADAATTRALERLFAVINAKASVPEDPRPLQRIADIPLEAEGEPIDPEMVGIKLEFLLGILETLADRRELETMRPIVAYVVGLAEPPQAPVISATLFSMVGVRLIRAGDEPAGRELIAKARKLVDEAPAGELRSGLAQWLARTIAEVDLDAALDLAATLPPRRRDAALRDMIEGLCTFDPIDWTDASGIKIVIGDPALRPKDDARARAALAKIAAVAKGTDEAVLRARTLAAAAHLQARAGDLAGALATAEAIPDVRRGDGPNDGFYDSVKPAAFALIAWRGSEAGDKAAASAAFARSRDLAVAVAHDAERLIAEIVLAQKLDATGRADEAKAVLADAIPRALAQPEPRRSRMLGMLAEVQLRTSGVAEAARTVDAIRDEPGLDKARALQAVATRLRDDGDPEAARPYARRALACLGPKPSDPKPVPGQLGVSRNGFLDYDQEATFHPISVQRASMQPALRQLAGEPDADLAAMPPHDRERYLSSKVGEAFRRGDLDEALRQAQAIEPPSARLNVLRGLAYTAGIDSEGK